MSKEVMTYVNVSTSSVACTGPALFYGLSLIPKTTGIVLVNVFDATATGTGTCIFGYRAASTAGTNSLVMEHPVACRNGIYISCPTITTAADQVVVFYASR